MNTVNRFSIFIFIAFNIALGIELGLRLFLEPLPQVEMTRNKDIYRKHPVLILENVRDTEVSESKYVDGQAVYENVTYSFDTFGRRVTTPQPERPKGSVLFFGSSVVFGKGIQDSQTLPSLFARANPTLEVHNYAVRSWGTQQYLHLIRNRDLTKEVSSPIGQLIFVISVNVETGHVQRHIGSMDLCTPCGWMAHLPVFRRSPDNNSPYEFQGTFKEFMPLRYYLFQFLQNLRLVRKLRWNPTPMSQSDYQKYVDLLHELYQTARMKYPNSSILFINHPFSDTSSSQMLSTEIERVQLPFLDLSDRIPKDKMKDYYFGHQWPYPRPSMNSKIVEFIGGKEN